MMTSYLSFNVVGSVYSWTEAPEVVSVVFCFISETVVDELLAEFPFEQAENKRTEDSNKTCENIFL